MTKYFQLFLNGPKVPLTLAIMCIGNASISWLTHNSEVQSLPLRIRYSIIYRKWCSESAFTFPLDVQQWWWMDRWNANIRKARAWNLSIQMSGDERSGMTQTFMNRSMHRAALNLKMYWDKLPCLHCWVSSSNFNAARNRSWLMERDDLAKKYPSVYGRHLPKSRPHSWVITVCLQETHTMLNAFPRIPVPLEGMRSWNSSQSFETRSLSKFHASINNKKIWQSLHQIATALLYYPWTFGGQCQFSPIC